MVATLYSILAHTLLTLTSFSDEETVKETPWLSDDLQERALLQLEVLLETHKKLRGNAVRYRLSIRRLQPVPMKLTDAIFDVYSWLRTWTTLFELTGDNVNYEGASKILDWHWRVCQIMQSSEGDESVGILSSKVGSDVPTKGHEQQHLPCQDKMTSVRFREEASIEAAVANRDISVSTGDTGSISGSGARDSRLEIGQASLSSEKPTMDPSPGQIQVPFQLPKDQLIMLNRKCPPNLPTVHVERVMKLKPTLVYFSELSDCEKATVVCETAQRWISDGSKQLGAKEVKSLSYLITTMHDFMARQNFGRALQSAGILHGAVIDEVAKMPTRLRRLIFMMWAKYWIGTSFNEPEPTVATSLRLTMMSMCGPKRIGPGVAS